MRNRPYSGTNRSDEGIIANWPDGLVAHVAPRPVLLLALLFSPQNNHVSNRPIWSEGEGESWSNAVTTRSIGCRH